MQKKHEDNRIDDLKRRAEQMGMVRSWESETLPPDVRERFWRQVVEFETAPMTTLLQQLREAGCALPEPESMTDDQVTAKLGEVIDALARLRVFLTHTDHLCDRDLYTHLCRQELPQEMPGLPFDPLSAWHVDIIGSGSEDDVEVYLKYYADEDARRQWLVDFPDYAMPPHEDLPYSRDEHLPSPY